MWPIDEVISRLEARGDAEVQLSDLPSLLLELAKHVKAMEPPDEEEGEPHPFDIGYWSADAMLKRHASAVEITVERDGLEFDNRVGFDVRMIEETPQPQ